MNPFVIVLTHNGERYVEDCFASLMKQTIKAKVIAVDNGSFDHTLSLIRSKYPSVQVIENKQNLGFAKGNNIGIHAALSQGADAVILLNQDTKVSEDFIETGMNGLKDPGIGLASPIILYFDEPRIWWCGSSLARGIHLFFLPRLKIGIHRHKKEFYHLGSQYPMDSDWIPGCSLFVKKEVFGKIGFLDESFFFLSEDVDFSLRARKAGFRLGVISTACVRHKEDVKGARSPFSLKSVKKLRLILLANFRLMKKHFSFFEMVFFYAHFPFVPLWKILYQIKNRNS